MCTSLATPPTPDEHSIVHIGRHADCAGRLSGQLMKTMRPIQGRIIPSHNARGAQQKDGHRKIPHRCATAVRGPAGGVSLASLDASHDRFFLPTFAALIPHFHNHRACARCLCTFGAGMRASRRAPPGFSRAHASPERGGPPRCMQRGGCGSGAAHLGLDARPGKPGGARRYALLPAGRCPPLPDRGWGRWNRWGDSSGVAPPRACAPTLGRGHCGGLLARLRQRPIAPIRSFVSRLCAISATAGATAPLRSHSHRCALRLPPRRIAAARCGAQSSFFFPVVR